MLSNKWIFTFILTLSIALLTLINNYYFYAHVERENERGAKRIQILINSTLALCKDNEISSSNCNKKLIETINDVSEYYYYTTGTVVKDSTGNILWKKAKNNHDKVAVLNLEIQLPNLNTSTTAIFKINQKWSNKNIALSVFRSMTFSLPQLIEKYQNDGFDVAWKFFTSVAWYRSRPAIGFALFTFLLFWLYRNREQAQMKDAETRDEKLKDSFMRNTILKKEKEKLETKYNEIYEKLGKYDYIINPPINTLKFDDLISIDTSGIGNKFRKTIEKLFFPIFQHQFNYKAKSLSEATNKLFNNQIISEEAKNYADIIRIYGNIDSHYNEQSSMTKDEVAALANYVILIVEEIVKKDLLAMHLGNDPKDEPIS